MQRVLRAAQALGLPVQGFSGRWLRTIFSLFVLSGLLVPDITRAATLTVASVSLSDSRPSQTGVTYAAAASSYSGSTIKCVKEVFATTPAGTTKPTGMATASGITIAGSQTLLASTVGWTRGGSDPDGTVTFINSGSSEAPSGTKTWDLAGFTNSSLADTTYWLRISTYGNADCVTSPVDNTTIGFIITSGSQLSLTVDQSLSFTVNSVGSAAICDGTTTTQASTATTLPFGTVTSAVNGVVCQDLSAATNSTGGYTISLRYTGKPANGVGGFIADQTGSNASPTPFSAAGTEAYGYTTDDATLGTGTASRFTNGGQKWAAATTVNSEVAFEPSGVTAQTYRIGHQVGVSSITAAGNYSTTIIYTCTPVY